MKINQILSDFKCIYEFYCQTLHNMAKKEMQDAVDLFMWFEMYLLKLEAGFSN